MVRAGVTESREESRGPTEVEGAQMSSWNYSGTVERDGIPELKVRGSLLSKRGEAQKETLSRPKKARSPEGMPCALLREPEHHPFRRMR